MGYDRATCLAFNIFFDYTIKSTKYRFLYLRTVGSVETELNRDLLNNTFVLSKFANDERLREVDIFTSFGLKSGQSAFLLLIKLVLGTQEIDK